MGVTILSSANKHLVRLKMGTTYCSKDFSSSFKNAKDFFVNHLSKTLFIDKNGKNTLLKHSVVGNIAYTLSEHPVSGEEGKTFKIISVIKIVKYEGEFGYKDMDESMGPFYYDCPQSILKESTIQTETAVKWRNDCTEYAKNKKNHVKKMKDLKSVMKAGDKYDMGSLGEVTFLYHYNKASFAGKNNDGKIYAYKYKSVVANLPKEDEVPLAKASELFF